MKLTPRFALVFILYATALLVGVGLLAYNSGRDSLRSAAFSELQTTALEKEAGLDRWIHEKQEDLIALAEDPATVQYAVTLLSAAPDSADSRAAHDGLVAAVRPRLASAEFLQVSFLHPVTGKVIVSTDASEEGSFQGDEAFFINGKQTPYVQNLYYSKVLDASVMIAATPIHDAAGQLLGVLAARLDLEGLDAIISRRTGLHQTDDAYLVNTSHLFVSLPRFEIDPGLIENGIYTDTVNQCLQEKSGTIETNDYRGVPAFIVYRWLPAREVCLVVKIDQIEAYSSIRKFGLNIALISALGLLVAAALAVALARSMTHPILELQSGAARFAKGELDLRLAENSRDELGQLAIEFNRMAESLAKRQTHIQRRAEQFFNLTLDLLCTTDSSARLLDLNPAWERILGYSRADLHGQIFTNLVHPEDIDLTAVALQRVVRDSAGRFESRFRRKDGQYAWLAWALVYSLEDRLLYGAARDITERKLAEERLEQKTEELQRSNRELEEFAYIASHDLQEPLHLTAGYVQLLARRYKGRLDADADEFISFALEGVNRMRNLITDLLAYSRISTRGKPFAQVSLEEIFKLVIENLQDAIERQGAAITHDPLPSVLGDDEQMVLLLQNLIDNAIKFHGTEPPRVHVGARQFEDRWLFFVRDNGIGIDPQYTERVFVIFQRLHRPDQYAGTGIGLAICRKVVERHGGRIWVDSEPGNGSTFYFTLQHAENLPPEQVSTEIVKPRSKETVVDRATDLI